MLVEKDREREDEDIGVFPKRQVQVGSTLRASTLESGGGGGHSSKEKERYKKRDEGGCVSPLAFVQSLPTLKDTRVQNQSAFYFPRESPCTKEGKESSKTTTFMLSVFLPLSFLRSSNDLLLQCL